MGIDSSLPEEWHLVFVSYGCGNAVVSGRPLGGYIAHLFSVPEDHGKTCVFIPDH